jgi:hypothetical protein
LEEVASSHEMLVIFTISAFWNAQEHSYGSKTNKCTWSVWRYIINIVYILHVYNILWYPVHIILPSMYVNLFILLPYLMLSAWWDHLKLVNAQVTLYWMVKVCHEQVLQFHSFWKEC